ncbi:MAG TPA: (Fe-S)-binding protein, partial [Thermoplasmata archaeon]|nr:(Fe-S)-binding protein [Thermoplasmata archaeon]
TSMYSVNNLILEKWPVVGSDNVLKGFIIGPPILAGIAAYVGLRRLGYSSMYWYRIIPLGAAFLIALGHAIWILWAIQGHAQWSWIAVFLAFLVGLTAVPAVAVTFLPERTALRFTTATGLFLIFLGFAVWFTVGFYTPSVLGQVEIVLIPNMHTIFALPIFSVITAYVALRRPYSTYEYLLNECYQCGKCHTVCPVTKVEDDAVGGLNLVYNSFKKEHDGVPLWTCLACDACSAVCPLDIQYSDYILEERAKIMGQSAVDGGETER